MSRVNLTRGSDFRWGAAGMSVAVIGLIVAALIFVFPFGQSAYAAQLRYSGALNAGDLVRIAGVNVGAVKSVELDGDRVTVKFTVDSDQWLGDRTSVEVKLLTPVGGHYLAVQPAGQRPLGDTMIPPERAKTAFELTNALEAAAPAVDKFDGTTLRNTIDEVNRAIAGEPDAVRNLMSESSSLISGLANQSGQLTSGMRVADEYVAAIAEDKALLAAFVRSLGVVAVKLGTHRQQLVTTFQSLRRLAAIVHRPIVDFGDHIEPSISGVEEIFRKLTGDLGKTDTAIEQLKKAIETISKMIGVDQTKGLLVDQSAITVRNSGLCVPAPGTTC
ncbi:MlaD family protein [Gordonia sp. CPCC 205333]|uniref:MlaD family protein n=1 Tax=Gordonia sp. CPCC 205333 TaxID=3140790 RepID=UPI003AF33467